MRGIEIKRPYVATKQRGPRGSKVAAAVANIEKKKKPLIIEEDASTFPKPILTEEELKMKKLLEKKARLKEELFSSLGSKLDDNMSRAKRKEVFDKHFAPLVELEKKIFEANGIYPNREGIGGTADSFRGDAKYYLYNDLNIFGWKHNMDYIKEKYKKLFNEAGNVGRNPVVTFLLKHIKNIIDETERENIGKKTPDAHFLKKYGRDWYKIRDGYEISRQEL